MTAKPHYQITSHPPGSLKEIWTLSWPLVLGFLSNGLMEFVDRVMLGQYSVKAMNACATAGSASFSFFILPMIVASISEVFVGRYNGEGAHKKMGSSVWQMIWFSLFMIPLFVLIAHLAPGFLFKNTQSPELNEEYFYWLTCFGVFFCLTKAIMGFNIGQGKVRVVALVVLFANICNIGLDYLFIFGASFFPSLGVKGAAIATVLTEAMMFFILFASFLREKNRKEKGSGDFKLNLNLLKQSLKIGVPASLAHLSDYVSYFIFLNWMNALGEDYLTIMVILQSFYMLFFFIIEGTSKGITSVVSNFIGARKFQYISKSVKSTFKLHLMFVATTTLVIFLFSPGLFSVFISQADQAYLSDPIFLTRLYKSSLYLCLFYLFDGMLWNFVGVLVAASDSRFIMLVGTLGPWLFSLLPIYFAIHTFHVAADQLWLYMVGYSFSYMLVFWLRYRTEPWKKKALIEEAPLLDEV